ncbi:MAG: F0F1 ATP synthase subunit epsilon [Phycisphaerales bacterium JB039]
MRLKVLLPDQALIDREIEKVIAESIHGSFCLKPRHIDFVAPLVAGILSFTTSGSEEFIGVGDGVLVKAGDEVLVSVRDAVTGADLGRIRDAVRRRYEQRRARERQTREVASGLEATLVRRFIELEEGRREVR